MKNLSSQKQINEQSDNKYIQLEDKALLKKSDIIKEVQEMVYKRIDDSVECDDESLLNIIDECINTYNSIRNISIKEREQILTQVFNAIRKMGILQELLDDDSITEIMVNGADNILLKKADIC